MLIHVLAEDPLLAEKLPESELVVAQRLLVARCVELGTGEWRPPALEAEMEGALGLLVLDGLMARELTLAGGRACELLGRTDLLRPWDDDRAEAPIPAIARWRVLQPARLAVLDGHFTQAAARWPSLLVTLHSRLMRRSRWLACFLALTQLPRLELRLLSVLWHLADRWGVVGPEGVTLPLPLTHATLAGLVGAQRPSVSRSMRALEVAGLIASRRGGGWVLCGDAQSALERARATPVTRVTGRFGALPDMGKAKAN